MKRSIVISLTIPLMVLGIMLAGCGEEDEGMDRPITPEPKPELTEAEREAEALKKAIAAMKKLKKRNHELFLRAKEKDDFSTLHQDREANWMEIIGFEGKVTVILGEIHEEENPNDFEGTPAPSLDGLTIEYLKLRFLHPEKSEEELFALFRELAKQGKTTVDPKKISDRYGI